MVQCGMGRRPDCASSLAPECACYTFRDMGSSSDLLSRGYLVAFATVFVGGFLTSLTPCVYPMISITVSLFGGRGENVTRSRAMALAAMYVAGIGVMYTGLGVSFALAGRAFGTFMGSPYVMVPIAILFLVMAASMFGAFELALPSGLQARLSGVGGKGFFGAFAMGLVGGIIAAPCTGPVLASVLAYVATTRSVAIGGSLLFTYALGMGVLFFVIAAFAVALPKSGGWMESVKSVFGIIMAVAALYFLRNVIHPLAAYGSRSTLFLGGHAGAIVFGVVLGGIHLTFHDDTPAKLRKALGVGAIVVGGFGIIGYLLTPKSAVAGAKHLDWLKGEAAGVAAAKAAHKPALLDFYADWCLPCKEMELKTFDDENVSAELERMQLVKVDMTSDEDPAVVEVKQRYHADTLPTIVLLDSDGKVAQTINHFVEPKELLPLLQKLK
jgi:thiol:disulfide interchange protein DsbD